MSLKSPALQAAKDKIEARRAVRSMHGLVARRQGLSIHQDLQFAQLRDGMNRYFVVRYCPACLLGAVLDLKRGVSDLPNAQQLGVKRARPWRMECTHA